MKKTLHIIDSVNEWVGKVVSFLMVAIILIMVFETAMRYLFDSPTIWASDTTWLISGTYFLLGAGYVLLNKAHVNMDVAYNRFPLRARAVIDLVTSLVFFAFCYVLLRYGIPFAWRSLVDFEVTMPPAFLPVYPTKVMLPIGAFLLTMQGLSKFVCDFATAISGKSYEY